ncbi:hypothetical protein ABZV75_28840 [Streptomyces flaveolus]|uniref:hypothetical protein n=1 Tax=Streptomyces flaveolus TaxID=67297 RepID=UPI0033BB841E
MTGRRAAGETRFGAIQRSGGSTVTGAPARTSGTAPAARAPSRAAVPAGSALAGVWWYVARRSYGTPTTAAYGGDRDQAELAEGIVRARCPKSAGPGTNRHAGYGRMNERAGHRSSSGRRGRTSRTSSR